MYTIFTLTPQPLLPTFRHGPRSLLYQLRALLWPSFTSIDPINQHISSNFVAKVFLRTFHYGYAARSLRVLRWNQSMGTVTRLWSNHHRIRVRTLRRDSKTTKRSHCLGKHPRPVSIYLRFFFSFSPNFFFRLFFLVLVSCYAFSARIQTRSLVEENDHGSLKPTTYNLPLLRKIS